MDIFEAVNIKAPDTDITTNEKLSHEEVYDRIIDYLGGLTAIASFIPFKISEIQKALEIDENLNNLPLKTWDAAAGFLVDGPHATPTFHQGLWNLYRAKGINCASASEGVCILKRAARRIAALSDDEIKKIYAEARKKPKAHNGE